MALKMRARKMVGTIGLVAFIIFWAFAAMALGVRLLEDASRSFELIYYLGTGCLWAFPAFLIIKWMLKPDPVE
ncbi:MAG: DUF2842 domain-containing protein [Pseudomonadota bacterium]